MKWLCEAALSESELAFQRATNSGRERDIGLEVRLNRDCCRGVEFRQVADRSRASSEASGLERRHPITCQRDLRTCPDRLGAVSLTCEEGLLCLFAGPHKSVDSGQWLVDRKESDNQFITTTRPCALANLRVEGNIG